MDELGDGSGDKRMVLSSTSDVQVMWRAIRPLLYLLLKVNLGVFKEIQMLVNFLRCFPNIETLHVEVTICMLIQLSGKFHHCFSLIEHFANFVVCSC